MKIRFGILGAGGISTRFAKVLKTVPGASLCGVATRDYSRAQTFADAFGGEAYESYEALAADNSIDIVYVGTIHNSHYDAVKLCLERGRNVLCEKPLVLHEREAQELSALAEEQGLFLMEAMWPRCNPVIRQATEWVRSGRLGAVKLVTASFCSNVPYNPHSRIYNPELAGGAIYDVGVYVIAFATGIVGEQPSQITGSLSYAPTGVDSCAAIALGFPSGAVASLTCGTNAKAPYTACVYGTEGHIVIEEFWRAKECCLYGNDGALLDAYSVEFEDGFSFQIEHVMDMLRQGKRQSDLVPLADSIACARVFDVLLGT